MKRILIAMLAISFLSSIGLGQEDCKKKLLLIAGRPSHGPGLHEFNAGCLLLQKKLDGFPNLEVDVQLGGWPKDDSVFDGVDAIFLFMDGGGGHPAIRPERLEMLGKLMDQGIGFGCAHYAVEVPKGNAGQAWQKWIGGYYEHEFSCNPFWTPEYKSIPEHPITKGVQPFEISDEWYMTMRFREEMKDITPILVATPSDKVRGGPYVYPKGPYPHIVAASGQKEVMMWATERADGGRGFGFTGGHVHNNWGNDDFRKTMLNALVWMSGLEVPEGGVASTVTEDELKQNLDPK
jgi:hypothetical protein